LEARYCHFRNSPCTYRLQHPRPRAKAESTGPEGGKRVARRARPHRRTHTRAQRRCRRRRAPRASCDVPCLYAPPAQRRRGHPSWRCLGWRTGRRPALPAGLGRKWGGWRADSGCGPGGAPGGAHVLFGSPPPGVWCAVGPAPDAATSSDTRAHNTALAMFPLQERAKGASAAAWPESWVVPLSASGVLIFREALYI
jgi:hypothetical protein